MLLAVAAVIGARAISDRLDTPALGPIVLVALAPLVPPIPIRLGLSLDDVLPVVGLVLLATVPGVASGVRTLAARHSTALLVAGIGVALVAAAGVASAVMNGNSVEEVGRMLFRSTGRYLFLAAITLLVASAVSRGYVRPRSVAAVIAIGGTSLALVGLFAYLIPLPDQLGVTLGVSPFSVLGLELSGRLAGTTGIANFTAAVLMVSALITAGLALASRARDRTIWWVITAIQLVAIVLTFTRSSMGLTILGLIVIVVLASRPLLLLPLGGLGLLVAVATPLAARFLAEGTDRLALWASAWTMMVDHPAFGVGAGRMIEVMQAFPERYAETELGRAVSTAHNTILLAGAELGVLGAIGVVMIYAGIAVAALLHFRRSRLARRNWILVAGALAVLAFLAQGITNNLITVGVTGVFGALALGGVLIGGAEAESTEEVQQHAG